MLKITDLQKQYTAGSVAVSHFNLDVNDGEIVALLGNEGSGKTTVLKLIAGATPKSGGTVLLDGNTPEMKDMIMVFDDLALNKGKTLRKNLEFSLNKRNTRKDVVSTRVAAAAEFLKLTHRLDYKVKELTEFEKRKGALARLLVRDDYKLVLVDDICGKLGTSERRTLWNYALRILSNLSVSVIFSTTEHSEAYSLADRVVALDHSEVKQIGAPDAIIAAPANVSAAKLTDGRYNIISAILIENGGLALKIDQAILSIKDLAPRLCSRDYIGEKVLVGFTADATAPFEKGVKVRVLYEEKAPGGRYLHCIYDEGAIQVFDKNNEITDGEYSFLPWRDKICLFDFENENCILI
ncbi:MAG: ATP-binding cassette domain-containing protein [Clostridiaceae bacterium]|jgi:ABC-type sugar transport system ATPase subunit|nr:ATP-binding cassette domain-containing protein [Clostridiaceae bacterium]